MVIYKSNNGFESNGLFPNSNFTDTPDEDVFVIDETTAEGAALAQMVIKLYPHYTVTEVDGVVTVQADEEAIAEEELLNSLRPSDEEVLKAEREIETIDLLIGLGVI